MSEAVDGVTTEVVDVLIVEDEDDVRMLMRTVLRRWNRGLHVAGEAADGAEGLERWAELEPGAVHELARRP